MRMSFLKKKNVILFSLIALLVVASYLNYAVFNKATPTAEEDNPSNAELVNGLAEEDLMSGSQVISATFFTDYRMEREKVRGENVATLEEIANDESASKDNIDKAQATIIDLVKLSEKELLVENMVKAKGYNDCVVFIHEGYVNVIVDSKDLSQQQAIQIQDIISKECSVELAKITIAVSGKDK